MKKFAGLLALTALVTMGAASAQASDYVSGLVAKAKPAARHCKEDPYGMKYSLCNQECRGTHSSGGNPGPELECQKQCLSLYCN